MSEPRRPTTLAQDWAEGELPGKLQVVAAWLCAAGGVIAVAGFGSFAVISDGASEVSPVTPPELARRVRWAWAAFTLMTRGGLLLVVAGAALQGVAGVVASRREPWRGEPEP